MWKTNERENVKFFELNAFIWWWLLRMLNVISTRQERSKSVPPVRHKNTNGGPLFLKHFGLSIKKTGENHFPFLKKKTWSHSVQRLVKRLFANVNTAWESVYFRRFSDYFREACLSRPSFLDVNNAIASS